MRPARGEGLAAVLLDFDGTLTRPAFDWPAMKAEMALPDETVSILDFLAAAPPGEARRVAGILERHEREAARRAEANEGARELVAFLDGREVPYAVVTNNTARHVRPMLERIGIAVEVLITRDIGVWKPDPRPAIAGAAALGVPPARCAFIGDGRYDMMAARGAGMVAVHLSAVDGVACDHRVPILSEAIPLLEALFS